MKRYTFNAQVTATAGSQTYHVDAESEEEARAAVNRGEGMFDFEEIEVQDLGPYELVDVDDVPADSGDQQ